MRSLENDQNIFGALPDFGGGHLELTLFTNALPAQDDGRPN
jgi:hypothetical protein